MAATQEIFKLEMATKSQIIIDDEIRNIIPPLTDEEYEQLKTNIIAEGCRDALVVWNEIMLDGHNRYEICAKYNISFDTIIKNFNNKDEAIDWIINNQLGRRNLTLANQSYLRGLQYQREKKKVGAPGNNKNANKQLAQNEPIVSTAERLATQHKVSPTTIKRDADFASGLDNIAKIAPELKTNILQGKSELTKKEISSFANIVEEDEAKTKLHQIQEKLKEKEIVAAANAIKQKRKKQKEEAKEQKKQSILKAVTSQPITDRYKLLQGDMTEVIKQIKDESIDVIITDPPYPKEYLPLYETLAQEAARVLKPGGSLLVMTGQSYLPEILALMTPYIQYHWTASYLTSGGQSAQIWQRKVNTFWKPLLWFVKGEYTGQWVGDVTKSKINDNDKRFHHWGQSESGMTDIIERFTFPGQTILDPFLGGGTTAVVAIKLGRYFVGIDIDSEAIETTVARLLEVIECSQSNKSEQDGEMKD